MKVRKLIWQILGSVLGIWLASQFVQGIEVAQGIEALILAGVLLGLVNTFLKPVFKAITFPLRFITLGLFNLLINMGIIWALDFLLPSLTIEGLVPLFLTTIIVFGVISLVD